MTSVKFKDNQLNGHTFLFAINVHEQRYQQFCHPKKHFSQKGYELFPLDYGKIVDFSLIVS
jgi:hypothetical protein